MPLRFEPREQKECAEEGGEEELVEGGREKQIRAVLGGKKPVGRVRRRPEEDKKEPGTERAPAGFVPADRRHARERKEERRGVRTEARHDGSAEREKAEGKELAEARAKERGKAPQSSKQSAGAEKKAFDGSPIRKHLAFNPGQNARTEPAHPDKGRQTLCGCIGKARLAVSIGRTQQPAAPWQPKGQKTSGRQGTQQAGESTRGSLPTSCCRQLLQ